MHRISEVFLRELAFGVSHMLVQLLYASDSLLPEDELEVERQVTLILSSAYLNNRKRGLTGILLHCGQFFAQILEGSEKGVNGAMQLIERDPRHANIRVLYRKQVEKAALPAAAMGCAGIGPKCPQSVTDTLRKSRKGLDDRGIQLLVDHLMKKAEEGDLDLPPVAYP
jgi:hypothetical protein